MCNFERASDFGDEMLGLNVEICFAVRVLVNSIKLRF